MNKSDSIKGLASAMCKAQAEMGAAHKGSNNPFFKSKYADLSEVVRAVKEPFSNNGLSYVQFPIELNSRIGVETILMHESGEWMSNEYTVPVSKQDAQGACAAITYCRRYGLQSIAGIPSDDDDGNKASEKLTPQIDEGFKNAKKHQEYVRKHFVSIEIIKAELAGIGGHVTPACMDQAMESWFEIPKEDRPWLLLATSKGGIFTTAEGKVITGPEFRVRQQELIKSGDEAADTVE